MRPKQGTYPIYYDNYIGKVTEDNVITALKNNQTFVNQVLMAIPADKENFAYSQGKWTVKQVVNHLIDTERIFSYRALRFGRGDAQKVLSFEEDDYAKASEKEVALRTLADLRIEFDAVRLSSISLFNNFSAENLQLKGLTPAGETSVLAIGFCICGHATHHLKVLHEKYL
jgi:DinB superfamily